MPVQPSENPKFEVFSSQLLLSASQLSSGLGNIRLLLSSVRGLKVGKRRWVKLIDSPAATKAGPLVANTKQQKETGNCKRRTWHPFALREAIGF